MSERIGKVAVFTLQLKAKMQVHRAPWPHPHDIVVAINPEKRQSLQLKAILSVLCGLFALLELAPRLNQWIDREQRSLDMQRLESAMRPLADSGKREAVIWMAQNFPKTEAFRLAPLVANGDAEAMMALAATRWKADRAGAEHLLTAAAVQGNPEAVKYRMAHPAPATSR